MAAPSGIVWGSTVGSGNNLGRIGIYVKLTSTATETTRHTEIWFWSKYSVSDSSNTFYYDDNATSATTSKGSVNIKTTANSGSGWSTTNQIKIASYDYTFTRGTSASKRNVAAKLSGIDIIGSAMTAKADYTIPALASYTVSYNVNGGSGQPSSQTKYYGKNLTLSSTKPTRTGYSFQGWATSASGSVTYKSGATYSANAAVTLYAVWKANTYTVKYNANGGTNRRGKKKTKTYGVALQLTGTATKPDYTFKGWATSEKGSVVYAAGANYTANANVTLYAVWEFSYVKPKISSYSVNRCTKNADNSYVLTADGNFARIKFTWSSSVANPTALIEWKETEDESDEFTLSGTSGTVERFIGGSFSTEKSYSIKVTVDDGKDPQSTTKTLPGVVFAIDVLAGGKGVSIGKPAELDDTFDVGFTGKFRKDVEIGEKTKNSDGKTGVHIDSDGFIQIQRSSAEGYHPYLAFFLDDATEANGQVRVNGNTKQMEFLSAQGYKFGNDIYLPNGIALFGLTTAGAAHSMIYLSSNDNTVVGYGGYENNNGSTNIYGKSINFYVKVGSNGVAKNYKPYYEPGNSFEINLRTAGYVSNSGKDVYFVIPLSRPTVGVSAISISSGDGFILRQGAKYTHGSSADKYVKPDSYTASIAAYNAIVIKAAFSDVTNVTNNDTVGVHWDGTVTFS